MNSWMAAIVSKPAKFEFSIAPRHVEQHGAAADVNVGERIPSS
jgi:hypothetical protein